MKDYIVLIRRNLSLEAAAALRAELSEAVHGHDSPMVFLHGEGVEHMAAAAQDPEISRVDWCVCRTSLARRSATGALPPPFRMATLVTFFQAALSAGRVDSLGLGGRRWGKPVSVATQSEASPRLLLEIGFAPIDQRQHRETLEMALGAAALELDAAILFKGKGLAHLVGDAARGWSQITDFDLLGMHVEDPAGHFRPDVPVQRVDADGAARLRAGAATTLIL